MRSTPRHVKPLPKLVIRSDEEIEQLMHRNYIELTQREAIKEANICDNGFYSFDIVDMKKLYKNNDFKEYIDSYDKKEIKEAFNSGARYMLAVYENNSMSDETITLQPIERNKMQSLTELNIQGLSNVTRRIWGALIWSPNFYAGDTIDLGIRSDLLDGSIVDIKEF